MKTWAKIFLILGKYKRILWLDQYLIKAWKKYREPQKKLAIEQIKPNLKCPTKILFDEPGKVVPRAEILEQLWGYPPRRAADLRVVDVYVARLRGKLEPDPRNPELILTVRGIGYASQRVGEKATSLASWYLFW